VPYHLGTMVVERAGNRRVGTAVAAIAAALIVSQAPTSEAGRYAQGAASRGDEGIRVALEPAVSVLHQRVSIVVEGVSARSVSARLVGATDARGESLPWSRLHRIGRTWQGLLRAPALRGVYPIQIRHDRSTLLLHSSRSLLRVFLPGTMRRSAYSTAIEVARAWVARLPGSMALVALRRWPQTALDRRDRRLNQLLVIAYAPAGDREVRDRLGIFIAAVRDGFRGRWRLLEATVQP